MDAQQAILLDALQVNAKLFQMDLCRKPEYRDVLNKDEQDKFSGDLALPSLALDTRIPVSITICTF